jgi:hypothetical protein
MILRLFLLLCLCGLPRLAVAQTPIPDDTIVSLQRGNCEVMECPIYRLLIFANGDVIWQGRGRVARIGVVQSRIGADQLQALIQSFGSAGYFSLENIYGFHGAGCQSSKPYSPMVITSFSMGGISKTISHHAGCVGEISDRLTALEEGIDRLANSSRWITGKPSDRKP